jgi:HK97 family phage portal protein
MGYTPKRFYPGETKASTSLNQAWSDRPELWLQMGLPTTVGRLATSSPVEAAVSIVSTDVGTLPIKVVEEREDGTMVSLRTTTAGRVLAKPNEYQTKTDFIIGLMRDVFFYGNAYAWADRDSRGQIMSLYPLRPRQVQPHIASDGTVYYSIALTELEIGERADTMAQNRVMVPADQMLHHRMFTANHPLIGVSPLYAIAGTAAMNAAISDNLAAFHQNNARPGGLLIAPGGMKQETRDRLRQDFTKMFSGANSGRTAVLDFDAKYEELGYLKANEQQAVELLRYSVEDVARALRIPLHMLIGTGQTGAGVEAANRLYYTHCLRPQIEALENRLDDLFGFNGTNRFIMFDLDQIFRAESDKRIEALTKGIQGGVYTPNEARRMESLGPVEGGDGAFMQRQMTPVNLLSELAAAELVAAQNPQPSPAPDADPVSPPAEDAQGRSINTSEAEMYAMLIKELCLPGKSFGGLKPSIEPKKANAADIAAEIRKELLQ